MLQAISITVREGFEAALVIGIMLTYAVKTGRTYLTRPILAGTIAAIAVSVLVALGLRAAGVAAENPVAEGVMYIVAALFVLSMVVWMWREGSGLRDKVQTGIDRAASGSRAASWGVAAVAFFMIVREGIETVLFMAANALDQGMTSTLLGGALGLVFAFGLGAAVFYGAARIDLKLFFAATSVALLLLASRFIGLGALELAEGGAIALPEAVEEGLELLERGALSMVVNVLIVGLPLGAVVWSLFHGRGTRTVKPA